MPRWVRVIRGMVGTGLMFALGVGGATAIILLIAMLAGKVTALELMQVSGKLSVVSFLLGVLFSGVLALTAGGRSFNKLSLQFVTALGAAGGFLYFLFIGFANGFSVWSPGDLVANLVLLTVMGAAAAAGVLLLARRAGKALGPADELGSIGAGSIDEAFAFHATEKSREKAT